MDDVFMFAPLYMDPAWSFPRRSTYIPSATCLESQPHNGSNRCSKGETFRDLQHDERKNYQQFHETWNFLSELVSQDYSCSPRDLDKGLAALLTDEAKTLCLSNMGF